MAKRVRVPDSFTDYRVRVPDTFAHYKTRVPEGAAPVTEQITVDMTGAPAGASWSISPGGYSGSTGSNFQAPVGQSYTLTWLDTATGYDPPSPATEGPTALNEGVPISFGPPTYVAEGAPGDITIQMTLDGTGDISGIADPWWALYSTNGGLVQTGTAPANLSGLPDDTYWVEWGWDQDTWQPFAYDTTVGTALRAAGVTIADPEPGKPWCSPAQNKTGGGSLTFTGAYTTRVKPTKNPPSASTLSIGQTVSSDLYWQKSDLGSDAMRSRSGATGGSGWPEADIPWPQPGNTVTTTLNFSSPEFGEQPFWLFWQGTGRVRIWDVGVGPAFSQTLRHDSDAPGDISGPGYQRFTSLMSDSTLPEDGRWRKGVEITSGNPTPISNVEIVHESYVDFDSPGVPSATQSFRSTAAGSNMMTKQAYEQAENLRIVRWLQAFDDVNIFIPGVETEGYIQLGAKGIVRVTGVDGSTIPYRQQFTYNDGVTTWTGEYNGLIDGKAEWEWFQNATIGDTVSGQVDVQVVFYDARPNYPVTLAPASSTLTVVSPPAGIDASATAVTDIAAFEGWEMAPYFFGSGRTLTTKCLEHTFDVATGWQYMVDYSNALNCDMWVTFPTYYTDAVVDGLIDIIEDPVTGLRDGLKVYVEYSNETWNFGFPQFAYTAQMGSWFAGNPIDISGRPFEMYGNGSNPYNGAPLEGFEWTQPPTEGFHHASSGYLARRLTAYNLWRVAKRYRAKLDTKHGTPYDYTQRIVVVCAGQAEAGHQNKIYFNKLTGWPWESQPLVTFEGETAVSVVDALSVAFYDYYQMDPTGDANLGDTYPTTGTNAILALPQDQWLPYLNTKLQEWIDDLEANNSGETGYGHIFGVRKQAWTDNHDYAALRGLRFIGYEGGEHNIADWHYYNWPEVQLINEGVHDFPQEIIDWYVAYHYLPKFYEKYWKQLNMAKTTGFDEIAHLGAAGAWAKTGGAGFFPIIETMQADKKIAQKYKALVDWQYANPKWW